MGNSEAASCRPLSVACMSHQVWASRSGRNTAQHLRVTLLNRGRVRDEKDLSCSPSHPLRQARCWSSSEHLAATSRCHDKPSNEALHSSTALRCNRHLNKRFSISWSTCLPSLRRIAQRAAGRSIVRKAGTMCALHLTQVAAGAAVLSGHLDYSSSWSENKSLFSVSVP